MKTTSVMQTLSGRSGRLSQGESDLNLPPGGSSEARGGHDSFCRESIKLPVATTIVLTTNGELGKFML